LASNPPDHRSKVQQTVAESIQQAAVPASGGSRLTPSRIVAFAVLASIPVKAIADRLSDPDLWWHLRTGGLIASTKRIPAVDPFSYTAPGEPWVVQEWGAEVILHWIHSLFGLYGILFYRGLALLAVYALMARLILKRMGGGLATWAWIALAAYTGIPNWTERPNLMSFFLFVVTLLLVERRDKAIWWFVPLAALWANLHGMVILGIGLLVVIAGAEWLKVAFRWDGAERTWATRVSLVAGAGLLATLANPEGPGLLVHAFRLVGVASAIVSEWRSPNFHNPGAWFFTAMLFLTILVFVFSPKRPDLTDIALALAFTFLALQAVRNLAVAGIVLGIASAPYVRPAFSVLPWRPKPRDEVSEGASRILGVAGYAAATLGLVAVLVTGFPRSSDPSDIISGYPVASIDRLDVPGARVFSYDVWSGMVIHRAWPNAHVFIDLRWDFYGLELSTAYGQTIDGLSSWKRNLDRFCTTHALIPPDVALATILRLSGDWRIVDRDQEISLTFARREPAPGCDEHPIPAI